MSNTFKQVDEQIVYNAVQCLVCGELIESTYRHDYKVCKCSNAAMVDGGLDYARYGAADMTKVRNVIVTINEPFEKVRKFAFRLSSIGKNAGKPVRLYKMSNDWLDNAIEDMIDRDYGPEWHKLLLIREKQYRIEHEIFIDEKDSIKKAAEAFKKRLAQKELSPLEKEEEVIRFPRVRTERGLPRP